MKDSEYRHKILSIIACVKPLITDAQFCLDFGDAYAKRGLLQEALEYYEKAERGFIGAEQRLIEILEKPGPTEFSGLKNLVTTGYMDED